MEKIQALSNDNRYQLKLIINETGTSTENNTSTISYKLSLIKTSGTGYYTYNANNPVSLSLNGDSIISQNISYDFRNATPKEIVVTEGTKVIRHGDDGNKTMSYSASFTDNDNGRGSASISGNLTLTPIPRASTIGVPDTNIGSSAVIVINYNSASFTHTITWSASNLSGTIATKTSLKTLTWDVPTSLYAKILNDDKIEVTVTCTTYSGNTQIGDPYSTTFKAKVDETANKPDVSYNVADINSATTTITSDPHHLIAFFSNVRAIITATPKNGASIKSYKFECGDNKSASATTSATSQTLTLNGVTSGFFRITVTDTREFSKIIEINYEIDPYIKLTINPTVKRKTQTGSKALVTINGDYYVGPTSEKGSWNTLTVRYRYKASSTSNWSGWTTLMVNETDQNTYNLNNYELSQNFDYQTQYDIQFQAFDRLMTLEPIQTLKVGLPNHWWNKTTFTHLTPVTAPTITQTSLEALKKNITKFDENALEIINNSELYNYNLKLEKDNDKKHVGFVIGDNYKTPNEVISQNGQGIDTYSMISILWKAVQDLSKKVKELEDEE